LNGRDGEERTGIIGQEMPALSHVTKRGTELHYVLEYRVELRLDA